MRFFCLNRLSSLAYPFMSWPFQRMRYAAPVVLKALSAIYCVLGLAGGVMAAEQTVRMVITAAFVSESGLPVYEDMAGYLAQKLRREVKVVSGISYEESDLLLRQGVIQVGFVCGLPYIHNSALGNYKLLAIPVMGLKKDDFADTPGYEDTPGKYFSYTIVHKDSPATSWQDLRGLSYAYNDQNSNSGYNMPRYQLVQLGAKRWEDWFSKVVVSGSHEESIRLVARGIVDSSSVDSLVLDYDRKHGNADALNVKVITTLFPGGAGVPPVVVSSKTDPQLAQALQDALLNMHNDPQGKRILGAMLMLRFDPPDDSNYDDIRRMEHAARSSGFVDHRP